MKFGYCDCFNSCEVSSVIGISYPDVNYRKDGRGDTVLDTWHIHWGLLKLYIMPEDRDSRCSSRSVQAFYLGRREAKLSWFSSVPPCKRRDNIFTGPQPLNCKLIIHQSPVTLRFGGTCCLRLQGQPWPPERGTTLPTITAVKRWKLSSDLQTQGQLQSRELCVLQARVLCI
jgi:hypothetical protein